MSLLFNFTFGNGDFVCLKKLWKFKHSMDIPLHLECTNGFRKNKPFIVRTPLKATYTEFPAYEKLLMKRLTMLRPCSLCTVLALAEGYYSIKT